MSRAPRRESSAVGPAGLPRARDGATLPYPGPGDPPGSSSRYHAERGNRGWSCSPLAGVCPVPPHTVLVFGEGASLPWVGADEAPGGGLKLLVAEVLCGDNVVASFTFIKRI